MLSASVITTASSRGARRAACRARARRRDVEQVAAAALRRIERPGCAGARSNAKRCGELIEEAPRQLDERDDVELQHLGVARPLGRVEAAEVAKPCVVDEDVDRTG